MVEQELRIIEHAKQGNITATGDWKIVKDWIVISTEVKTGNYGKKYKIKDLIFNF